MPPLHTDEQPYFLRSEAKMELLAYRWYAWPHLVSPVQHAMNVAFRHIPLLESFLENPAMHAQACADPAMLGGPFVDLPEERAAAVRKLLRETKVRGEKSIRLAKAWREINERLQKAGQGYSLDGEYCTLPPFLRGLVELVYDTNSHPKLRILEELACQEEFADLVGQEVCLSLLRDEDRKFFLTTPRLESDDTLTLDMGFADPKVDLLAAWRLQGVALAEMCSQLELPKEEAGRLERFLTREPPQRIEPEYRGAGVRVRHFGHACVLIQSVDGAVLIDPLPAWERDSQRGSTLAFCDLPDRIDRVVFSHCHMDHCCPEVIVQLRRRVGEWIVPRNNCSEIADPSMKLILKRLGCQNIRVLDPFDRVSLGDGEIVSLPFPGEHCGLDIASKQSVVVTKAGRTFVFLVDSDAVDSELYRRIARFIGRADGLFIGMECYGAPLEWMYGPLLGKDVGRENGESRRGNASNCERAWHAIKHVDCDNIYVYAMGSESWNRYLLGLEYSPDSVQITESEKFMRLCRSAGKSAVRLTGCRDLHF